MTKKLWMCWFQGEERAPKLNKECIKRWKKLNPDWEINVLNHNTIPEYAPDFFHIIKDFKVAKHTQSDLLRLLLLKKHGGVWADASLFPTTPLSDFMDEVINETGFFTYRFSPRAPGARETVSWFLATHGAEHPLICKWLNKFSLSFSEPYRERFFLLHRTLSQLYDSDPQIKRIINSMVQISEKIPHSGNRMTIRKKGKNLLKSYMYKRPPFEILSELKNLN